MTTTPQGVGIAYMIPACAGWIVVTIRQETAEDGTTQFRVRAEPVLEWAVAVRGVEMAAPRDSFIENHAEVMLGPIAPGPFGIGGGGTRPESWLVPMGRDAVPLWSVHRLIPPGVTTEEQAHADALSYVEQLNAIATARQERAKGTA